jgi:hypothetical protein
MFTPLFKGTASVSAFVSGTSSYSSQDSSVTAGFSLSSSQDSAKIAAARADNNKNPKEKKGKVEIVARRKNNALTEPVMKDSGGHVFAVQAVLVATIIRVGTSLLWHVVQQLLILE